MQTLCNGSGPKLCDWETAIPLVSGAFGELNVEGHRFVELCARYAAAIADNSDITPEEVRSAWGSPYNLLLSQLRRA